MQNKDEIVIRCFYDRTHDFRVPNYIYDAEGFLKLEFKGRVLDDGVKIGAVGIYCSAECYDAFCGPKPSETLEDSLDKLEEISEEKEKDVGR